MFIVQFKNMDLLGSIMNSMDKPPSLSEKEKLARKSIKCIANLQQFIKMKLNIL